jgi:cation:H+ antiporter
VKHAVNLAVVIILFLLGLLLIVKGGDWFLDGAVWIAEASGIPRFIVGATVVSIATTLPELTVSVTGVLEGQIDLAVGNAVGSVTANIGLILGISVLCMPSAVHRGQFTLKAIMMLCGAVLLTVLCQGGSLPLIPSLLLFAVFALYLGNNIYDAKISMAADRENRPSRHATSHRKMVSKLGMFALGVAGIIIGSQLLIDYGSELALRLGVPASIIGVTLVAVGTSLPELVTTLTAILKKEASMSIGNIVGANVIDLTLILPVCSAISGGSLAIGRQTTALDLPVCLAVGVVAMLPPLVTGRFYRWQGFALLGLYAGYMAVLMA